MHTWLLISFHFIVHSFELIRST